MSGYLVWSRGASSACARARMYVRRAQAQNVVAAAKFSCQHYFKQYSRPNVRVATSFHGSKD